MKFKVLFVLGRPGCGKSALYRELERQLLESGAAKSCQRVDDFPMVWNRLLEDDRRERQGKPRLFSIRRREGVYGVTDYAVMGQFFNEILEELCAEVLAIDRPDHVVVVEFARSSYVEAVARFDRAVLEKSLIIYMQVSFETCWARNVARHEAAVAAGGDDHLVPREAMERYYLVDDRDPFLQAMAEQGIPAVVVDNEREGEEHLIEEVAALFQRLF